MSTHAIQRTIGTTDARTITGATVRQSDHWAQAGWLPVERFGIGVPIRWTRQQVAQLAVAVRLVNTGIPPRLACHLGGIAAHPDHLDDPHAVLAVTGGRWQVVPEDFLGQWLATQDGIVTAVHIGTTTKAALDAFDEITR